MRWPGSSTTRRTLHDHARRPRLEVTLEPRDGGTFLTLQWTPLEYSDAALAMFVKQMAGMTGGWGGSFDKLEAWLAG